MKKLEYIEEKDFSRHQIEFEDEHVYLAETIKKLVDEEFDEKADTPLMVSEDKKSLVFSILAKNRNEMSKDELYDGKFLYRIRIEKVFNN